MMVNINGAYFNISPPLKQALKNVQHFTAKEVHKVWPEWSYMDQRRASFNIIIAYFEARREDLT